MFLNTKGRDVTGAEPELIAFLRFVENSTAEEAHLSEDPRIQEMYRKINTLKNSEAVEADYMTAEKYKRRLQEEAEEKGKIQTQLDMRKADIRNPLRYLLMNAVASRSVSGSFQLPLT